MTLAHYARNLPHARPTKDVRPFIEASAANHGQATVTIVLDLARIDSPALRKTVIMVRQWKGLSPGRHEYGEALRFG